MWLLFSILAPATWAITNVADQILIQRAFKSEIALTAITMLFRLPFIVVLLFLSDWHVPPPSILAIAVAAGLLYVLATPFYYKTLKTEEAHAAILVHDATNPLFVFLLASTFLGERLGGNQSAAFGLLLLAGILSSLTFGKKIHFRSALLWIVISALVWAVSDVIWDWLVPFFPSLYGLVAWTFVGTVLGGLALSFLSPRELRIKINTGGFPLTTLFLVGILTSILGNIFFLQAIAAGPITLTAALSNFQPLFVFIFALVISSWRFAPEKLVLNGSHLIPKALALACAVAGAFLLQ